MIEKIEKFLEGVNLDNLSMNDLKAYTEAVITLDQYKSSKELLQKMAEPNAAKIILN